MQFLFNVFNVILNFIYPARCVFCKKIIEDQNSLCEICWKEARFIQQPCCNICSTPLKYKVSENDICPSCVKQTPSYTQAKAVMVYDRIIAKLILAFKYYDRTHLAKFFAELFAKHAQDITNKTHFIIPVPLHKNRLKFRKYNQSALLVKAYAKLAGKEYILDFLIRKRETIPQVKLKSKDRYKNLGSVFKINPKYIQKGKMLDKFREQNFLLIDDVMTTGTTVNECAKELLKRGAKNVYVLTIAKTVLDKN